MTPNLSRPGEGELSESCSHTPIMGVVSPRVTFRYTADPLVNENIPKSVPVIWGGKGLKVAGRKSQPKLIMLPDVLAAIELPERDTLTIEDSGLPFSVIVNTAAFVSLKRNATRTQPAATAQFLISFAIIKFMAYAVSVRRVIWWFD
jgi:hypothetical protein